MKKFLALLLVLVIGISAGIGGTVAYLTDTEETVNVMTVGNVDIMQLEYERVVDENGKFVTVDTSDVDPNYGYKQAYALQPFTQGKAALPAVYNKDTTAWDEFQQLWNQVGAPGSNDLFDDSMANVIDKFVFVKNIGNEEAYYRTIIAIESPEDISEKTIHTNFNANSRFDYNSDKEGVQNAADSNKFYTTIGGVRYLVYTATYTEKLAKDEVSRPSLLQVYLDPKATNEDVALFGDTWDILVVSQAVQADGWQGEKANAQSALDEAFDKVNAENVQKWFGDVEGVPEVVKFEKTGNAADNKTAFKGALKSAIEEAAVEGKTEVTVDAEGATMDLNYGLSATTVPEGTTVTIANAVIEGKSYGNAVDGTVVFENCTFANTGAYSIHFDAGNGNVVFKNCTLSGWCSFGSAIQSVTMENCTINGNGTYAMVRFYQDTTLTNCTIDCSNANTEDIYTDGVSVTNGKTLTLINCTVTNTEYEVGTGKIVVDGITVNEYFE